MADEEPRRDFSRSATVNSNHGGARSAPIQVTPLSTAVRDNRTEPSIRTGFLRPLVPAGTDLSGISLGNQQPETHAQNASEILPVRSAEVPAGPRVMTRSMGYFRTAMQYLRELEMQSISRADHEVMSSSRFGNGELNRLREHEQTSDQSKSMVKRNISSELQVGTIAASLTMEDGLTATPAMQGAHRSVMGLDDIETGESDMQSQHEIATLPIDTSTFGSTQDAIIPGEGQPEETFDGAPYWIEDTGDSETNNIQSAQQGFSGPGLDDIDLLADNSSPLSTPVAPTEIAAANSSTEAGSTNIESIQICGDSAYSDDATEIGSQTVALIDYSSVRSLGSPEERFDDFPELTDEDLARIDALSEIRPTARREVANTIHTVRLDDAFSSEDFTERLGGGLTNPAVRQEGSRQEPSPSDPKSDDFPELTDEDLARIDALSEARPTTRREVANTIHAVRSDGAFSPVGFPVGRGGGLTNAAVRRESSRQEPSPSEPKSDDCPELTDEDLARIDAISEPHSKRYRFEQGVGENSHKLSVKEAIREVGWPNAVSGTKAARAAPVALESGVPRLPQANETEPTASDVARPLQIDNPPSADTRRDVSDKGKRKISLHYEVQQNPGATCAYRPHPSTRAAFDAEQLGDNLLIGHEPVPRWPHPLDQVVLFETGKQLFERLRRWPAAEELEKSVILVKADGAQRSYMPRNQLLLHLGPEQYLERMKALGLPGNTFSGLKSDSKYFYDTPAGLRVSEHDYEFPRQAGVHNPEVMVQHPSGMFFAFWPKLLRLERLATVTNTYGAENVWLKSPTNAYMTPETYNSKAANGAENLFIEFLRPDPVHDHSDPGTSNTKTVDGRNEGRAQQAEQLADRPMGRNGDGRDAQGGKRTLEPRVRETYGL
ncbi:virA/G regulated protein [Allorhizobium ampelinum]|uniref:VirA/G regulated protein n=2 Tax=Rhizobium/Agrobacterium group TaxID=227290 RepID=B9K402_ALLAM|nr:virA/G regulated protein [Allorhizobium ampelinum S4]ASK49692.1 virA/G regulated protein [Agrobacterium vitis]OVE86802.1 virA/G regulated protein [Allorhizobium ampelinum]